MLRKDFITINIISKQLEFEEELKGKNRDITSYERVKGLKQEIFNLEN